MGDTIALSLVSKYRLTLLNEFDRRLCELGSRLRLTGDPDSIRHHVSAFIELFVRSDYRAPDGVFDTDWSRWTPGGPIGGLLDWDFFRDSEAELGDNKRKMLFNVAQTLVAVTKTDAVDDCFRAMRDLGEAARDYFRLRGNDAGVSAWQSPAAISPPGTGQDEGDGTGTQGDRTPAPGAAKATGDGTNRDKFDKLPKARRLAYFAFQYAAEKTGTHPEKLKDLDAWNWLRENGIDEPAGLAGELAEYYPPENIATWAKYLGDARKALDEQKRRRGTPTPTGHSVVGSDEI